MAHNTDNTEKKKWHAIDVQEVVKSLNTDEKHGLDNHKIRDRLEQYGRNELPKGKKRSAFMRFMLQFHNVLIYVLLVAAVVTALMDHWIDTWVIVGVVVINAIIGFMQEGKAEKALDGIRKMLSLDALVMRAGRKATVDAEELVPGDIVMLQSGDKIPADVRIIHAKDFKVEESPLTGESSPVKKQAEPVDEGAVVGDRFSLAFSGTVVTYGNATAVVVETGAATEIGKINQMMAEVKEVTTPLLQQIERFGKWLSVFILGIAGAFFAFGYFYREYELTEMFLVVIGIIVAAIPEGLPAIMTITLAIGVQRMASRNAIIRSLPSVETLGAVNVICSDKTGTLTRNEMTAKAMLTSDSVYHVNGTGYKPQGNILKEGKEINPQEDEVIRRLAETVRATNNADVSTDENGHWQLIGSPTEGALLTLSLKAGLKKFDRIKHDSIPFESEHKYTAVLSKTDEDAYIFITGAPDRLLDMCSKQYTENGEVPIDKESWTTKMDKLAGEGQRLIGAAFIKADQDRTKIDKKEFENNEHEGEKVFIGVVGIIDPPRDEAIEAVKLCKSAGVKVKMITGDHAITASSIAKQIGIGDGTKAITGKEIEEMSDEQLRSVVDDCDVYARTSPENKLRLVTALQANGHRCAMTGDGVNDAPALKKADIGIAMGIKGTEVTKDASEMVLTDDNFSSIASAIEEGRTVYDNIRKALLFILPTNGAETLALMIAVILGLVMPITPAQILWVNMVTAVTLALAISFEPKEEEVMLRPPRASSESILGRTFVWRILFVSVLIGGITTYMFIFMKSLYGDEAIARTVAVNTLVAGQLFYLFNCRRIKLPSLGKGFFNNKYAFIAAGLLIVLQLLFVYLPFMNTLFETTAIDAVYWLYPLGAGLAVFIIVEIEKFIVSKVF